MFHLTVVFRGVVKCYSEFQYNAECVVRALVCVCVQCVCVCVCVEGGHGDRTERSSGGPTARISQRAEAFFVLVLVLRIIIITIIFFFIFFFFFF